MNGSRAHRVSLALLVVGCLGHSPYFPVAKADTDDTQIFSFYIGIGKL